MAIRVSDPEAGVDGVHPRRPVADGIPYRRDVFNGEADIDVDSPTGVRQPEVGFPEFDVERAGSQSGPTTLIAKIDEFEVEGAVKRQGGVEVLYLEDHLEETGEVLPGAWLVPSTDLHTVPGWIVQI